MAEDPCLPAPSFGHPTGGFHHHSRAHNVIGRITHRVNTLSRHPGVHHPPASVACGRPEAIGGGLPAMPAGRGLARTIVASGKLAHVAKAGALLTAVSLAAAGAITVSGLVPATPITAHISGPSSDIAPPAIAGPTIAPHGPGRTRVPVPEPPSGTVLITATACVAALRWLMTRKSG